MHHYLLGTVNSLSSPRITLSSSLALHYRCIGGVLRGYQCKSPQSRVTEHVSSHQSYVSKAFVEGTGLVVFEMVNPSNTQMDYLPN
jgi:hypothetical protein